MIRRRLEELLPQARVFLDVEDLDDTSLLEEYVEQSASLLVFLSKGYFLSRNCIRELTAAVERRKPLILVHELDRNKGGAPRDSLIAECPRELREAVFGQRDIVPWLRLGDFQCESLLCIAEAMLLSLPRYQREMYARRDHPNRLHLHLLAHLPLPRYQREMYARRERSERLACNSLSLGFPLSRTNAHDGERTWSERSHDPHATGELSSPDGRRAWRGVPVHVPRAITESSWGLPRPLCLYVAQHCNPGASQVAEELREACRPDLVRELDPSGLRSPPRWRCLERCFGSRPSDSSSYELKLTSTPPAQLRRELALRHGASSSESSLRWGRSANAPLPSPQPSPSPSPRLE